MMPVAELVRFAETLDDAWHSPVADAAAERWGVGRPVFVRSSASHVLVAGAGPDRPRLVLRMRPDDPEAVTTFECGARAALAWHGAGAPFVPAVPSVDRRLVERVDGYVVTALRVAEGETLDDAPVTERTASDWGAALASLHAAGPEVDQLASALPTTEGLACGPVDDELAAAAEAVRNRLAMLSHDAAVRGVLHGDPEADNVIRTENGLVLVDPDDVRVGWFAADVAFALRDWQDPDGRLDWAQGVPAAFVAGYRTVRPLTDDELTVVPVLVRAAALEDLVALQTHLDAPVGEHWPEWATQLQARIRRRVAGLRHVALGAGG